MPNWIEPPIGSDEADYYLDGDSEGAYYMDDEHDESRGFEDGELL